MICRRCCVQHDERQPVNDRPCYPKRVVLPDGGHHNHGHRDETCNKAHTMRNTVGDGLRDTSIAAQDWFRDRRHALTIYSAHSKQVSNMMNLKLLRLIVAVVFPVGVIAQSDSVPDQRFARLARLALDSSRLERLAHSLLDSIGPRLSGTPPMQRGNDWLL